MQYIYKNETKEELESILIKLNKETKNYNYYDIVCPNLGNIIIDNKIKNSWIENQKFFCGWKIIKK